MVVKRITLFLSLLCCVGLSNAQHSVIHCYRLMFVNHDDIEAGIELWLEQHPEFHNHDGWEIRLRNSGKLFKDLDGALLQLKSLNYMVDFRGYKDYIVYDAQKKVYYPIRVLGCIGYIIGCDVCVMNIVLSNGRGAVSLTSKEKRQALRNFKRKILPQIKKYIKKQKALQKGAP